MPYQFLNSVGGATLPDPQVSLVLKTLKNANPPRDRINACRQLTANFLGQEQVESLAAFVLTAAKKAPGWGKEDF